MVGKTFNKGEWAELFLLYRLLGDGKIRIYDPSMTIFHSEMTILAITRENEPGVVVTYSLYDGVVNMKNGDTLLGSIDQYEFSLNASKVKKDLLNGTGPAFALSDKANEFMVRSFIKSPKAKSLRTLDNGLLAGGKCDLSITYSNPKTGAINVAGFSVKSSFSHASTLQNGSGSTNFLFCLDDLLESEAAQANSIVQRRLKSNGSKAPDIMARCDYLASLGKQILPVGVVPSKSGASTFRNNLMIIDSNLPDVLSQMLMIHYFGSDHECRLSEMPRLLAKCKPVKGRLFDEIYYSKRLKDYLFACFSGMVPSTPWIGRNDVDGGYIIVGKDFEPSACLSTERDAFMDYLLGSTKLEHPDSSKNRADYGEVFRGTDGRYYIRLNLQIRFM